MNRWNEKSADKAVFQKGDIGWGQKLKIKKLPSGPPAIVGQGISRRLGTSQVPQPQRSPNFYPHLEGGIEFGRDLGRESGNPMLWSCFTVYCSTWFLNKSLNPFERACFLKDKSFIGLWVKFLLTQALHLQACGKEEDPQCEMDPDRRELEPSLLESLAAN